MRLCRPLVVIVIVKSSSPVVVIEDRVRSSRCKHLNARKGRRLIENDIHDINIYIYIHEVNSTRYLLF